MEGIDLADAENEVYGGAIPSQEVTTGGDVINRAPAATGKASRRLQDHFQKSNRPTKRNKVLIRHELSQVDEDTNEDDDDGEFNALAHSLQSPFCGAQGMDRGLGKRIMDPIHGHIHLSKACIDIMDSPQFQRLRDIKQLGSCCFVFPGASHTRAEHSIGVSHLAGEFAEMLKAKQPELQITEREIDMVKVAALCHDLGHGPFSHVFDGEVIPKVNPHLQWTHEKGSTDLLDLIIDEKGLEWEKEEIDFMKGLIDIDQRAKTLHKPFLYEIIANERNSIDVDKFDYLARDSHNTGVNSAFDHRRLIPFSRVIEDEICFHANQVITCMGLYHTRYNLFKNVYTHRVGKAVEYMIRDALIEANSYLKLDEVVTDPHRYTYLTDSILNEIERSDAQELKTSKEIIRRIRRRELYKFVNEIIIPTKHMDRPQTTAESIVSWQSIGSDGQQLYPDDIIVQDFKINYCKKDRDPLDYIHFFKHDSADAEKFTVPNHKVSLLYPSVFQERIIRIFVKDPKKAPAAHRAFKKCMIKLGQHKDEADDTASMCSDETMMRRIHTDIRTPVKISRNRSLNAKPE